MCEKGQRTRAEFWKYSFRMPTREPWEMCTGKLHICPGIWDRHLIGEFKHVVVEQGDE